MLTIAQIADLESRVFVVDGPDGSGKSTAAARLATMIGAPLWKAPSHTPFGEAFRQWCITQPEQRERNLLAAAADWRDLLLRALDTPGPIVFDRGHLPSSFAYQAQSNKRLLQRCYDLLVTDLPLLPTVILLPPVEVALARLAARTEKADALDREDVVRKTYEHYYAAISFLRASCGGPAVATRWLRVIEAGDMTPQETADILAEVFEEIKGGGA
jgi:thymidylate kinase